MLARCSRASLFHRFHGFTDGVAYTQPCFGIDQTAKHFSLGMAQPAWEWPLSLSVPQESSIWESWWRTPGSAEASEPGWLTSLLDGARAKGVTTVHADVLGDDLFILQSCAGSARSRYRLSSGPFRLTSTSAVSPASDREQAPRRAPNERRPWSP